MSTTDNLALTLIETNQSQKEVTANSAFAAFDAAICEAAEVEIADGTNEVAAATMRGAQTLVLVDSGSPPSSEFYLELEPVKRLLVIVNATAYDATIVCADASSGAAEASIAAEANALVYCDATQVHLITADLTAIVDGFTDLSDSPADYSGAGMKKVRVNSGGTALEFATDIQSIPIAVSDETTDLSIGTAKITFRMPYAFTLTAVRASVTTAPTGSTLTVDINEAGSTILSTKLTIDASEKTSTTAAAAAVISDASLADDAEITIDIDQVGSTVPGAGLKVYLIGRPT